MLCALAYATILFQVPLMTAEIPVQNQDTVPVIELTTEDTAKALAARDRLVQAEEDWQAFQQAILQKYTYRGQHHYSQDFRILVGTEEPVSYVELTQAEVAKARTTNEAMLQARREWNHLRSYIINNYVRAPASQRPVVVVDNIRVRLDRRGLVEFRFTQDCRFILPRY